MASLDAAGFAGLRRPVAALTDRAEAATTLLLWGVVAAAWGWIGFGGVLDTLSTDDAMRLVEVRDFLAGQGWFDLLQRRLDPPDGVLMHWSRLIDFPIAALLWTFERLLAPETALKATLTVWPLLPLAPALIGASAAGRALGGPGAGLAAALLFALSPGAMGAFQPGAIDHHGPQIALAMALLACVLRLDRSDRAAVGGGLAAAAMLAIGLETLPALASLAAIVALRFAIQGEALVRGAALFGASFALFTAAAFVATVPPARWFEPACDALASGHLVAAALGGGGLALATRARGDGALARLAALALVGAVVVIGVALVAPACLGDPYAALPERLKLEWLDRVREARGAFTLWADDPETCAVIAVSALFGLAATAALCATSRGDDRWRAWTAAVAVAVACLVAAWQIRGISLALAFVTPVLGAVAVRFARNGEPHAARAALALIALNPVTAGVAGLGLAHAASLRGTPAPVAPLAACPRSDYAALARLSPGLALNNSDAGPFVLAFTPHAVVAAPYHRGVDGLTAQVDALTGSAEEARAVALSRRAAYVVICPGQGDIAGFAARYPDGFAAALLAGETPTWLRPVDLGPDARLRAYRVAP